MNEENVNQSKEKKTDFKIVIITIVVCALLFIPLGLFAGPYLLEKNATQGEKKDSEVVEEEKEIELTADKVVKAMDAYNKIYIYHQKIYTTQILMILNL